MFCDPELGGWLTRLLCGAITMEGVGDSPGQDLTVHSGTLRMKVTTL